MNDEKNTAVITVLGQDRVGIIAGVANLLAEYDINLSEHMQTILKQFYLAIDFQKV